MWKKLKQVLYGSGYELRDRMLSVIIAVGGLVAIVGVFEVLFVTEMNIGRLCILILMLFSMGISWFMTFKHSRYDVAAIIVGVVVILILFPSVFLISGGIDGGSTVWMALGIVYTMVMFKGKKQKIFMVLSTVIYGGCYLWTYYHPEFVKPLESRLMVYVDSYFSVMAVGVCFGIIMRLQMRVFEEEHKVNVLQQEELERNSNSKNVFFANMSHEIRTPINAIMGLNELILRTEPSEEVREYAKDIGTASKMLLGQVNDILDLSQMEMKKMRIVPVEYRTEDLFGELVELIRVQTDKKGLELNVEIDKDIPSVLMGDEKRLKQILLNILDNANKYTREGSVSLFAKGELSSKGELILEVKIEDTGIGIRKEDIDYLYDSFNRIDEKKNNRIVGSGLGLAIIKQLVDLMEGEIAVDSIYTKGTVFTVRIKQRIVDNTPMGVINFMNRETVQVEKYQHLFEAPEARVLVVDDNEMNSMIAKKLLSATKVQIDVAGSGEECLKMTKKKYYHVILLDYMMPDMDGTQVLKELRNQENGLCRESAVIALTANTIMGARQLYLEQGFDGYVEKPIHGKLFEMEVFKFIPSDIIEYLDDETVNDRESNPIQSKSRKKRKKIYVTADCCCDLPPELLEKYDIKLMYLYIKTPYGRFADTIEIDSDSLSQYTSFNSSTAFADSVTVEEYEEFFAEVLTQAEQVVHISLGSKSGKSYSVAVEAAKGFDHVHVIDSCQASCGQGLVTLHAAKMALDGKSVSEICAEVEQKIPLVQTMVIMPGADIFHQNSRMRAIAAKVCRVFSLHPMAVMKHTRPVAVGLLGGTLEKAWKQGIRWHLHRKRKINKEVVCITHVGLSVKQQEWLLREIKKQVNFKRVIINKTSFSTACNVGLKSIGISYYGL